MSNSNSAINPSAAVVLKVKDGYAQDTAALLQKSYEQVLSYTCDDLIHNAGRRLQAAFHTFYRIAVMLQWKLFIQDFQPAFKCFQCAAVLQHDFLIPAIFA